MNNNNKNNNNNNKWLNIICPIILLDFVFVYNGFFYYNKSFHYNSRLSLIRLI